MENITSILLLKEARPDQYQNFLTEVTSSEEKREGYKARCDMELSRLEQNPKSSVDFYTMRKFVAFIYDAEFGDAFYEEHVKNILISFDEFLQKQKVAKEFREIWFEHFEKLKSFSPNNFGKYLSFYEDLLEKNSVLQN